MDKNKLLTLIIIAGSLAIVLILAAAGYQAAIQAMEESDKGFSPLATLTPPAPGEPTVSATLTPGNAEPSPSTTQTNAQDSPARLAPDFTVYDLEGNAHKLSDFRGKPVVLNFWASWCGPCKSEMPDFHKAWQKYEGQVHFLMVNLTDGYQETVESASGFISKQGYGFPVYYDTDVDAAATYGVSAVPVTYFIDQNGYLIAYGQGALSASYLQKGIDLILPK